MISTKPTKAPKPGITAAFHETSGKLRDIHANSQRGGLLTSRFPDNRSLPSPVAPELKGGLVDADNEFKGLKLDTQE